MLIFAWLRSIVARLEDGSWSAPSMISPNNLTGRFIASFALCRQPKLTLSFETGLRSRPARRPRFLPVRPHPEHARSRRLFRLAQDHHRNRDRCRRRSLRLRWRGRSRQGPTARVQLYPQSRSLCWRGTRRAGVSLSLGRERTPLLLAGRDTEGHRESLGFRRGAVLSGLTRI